MAEIPPELQRMADELGIDTSQLSGGAGFQVYIGGGQPRFIRRRGPSTSTGPLADPDQAFRSVPGEPEPFVEDAPDATSTVDELLKGLFTKDPDELRRLQSRMVDAGYFRVRPENIGWGRADRHTVDAYNSFLNEAAAYYQAGIRKPLDSILDEAIRARQEGEEMAEPEPADVIRLSDPASLRRIVQTVANELTGGKVDPEVESRIANAIRSAEFNTQAEVLDAPDGGSVTVDSVDARSRAEELLRAEMPEQVAATQGADGYRAFLQMLGPGGIR